MKIFVFGGGGREHAICKKLKESSKENKIFSFPSNGGIDCLKENINFVNINESIKFIIDNKIDLVVIGPEQYLEDGIVDLLKEKKVNVFGPIKNYAKLESSKFYAKSFMNKYNIPTSNFNIFDNENNLKRNINLPVVLKYDGLAAGKGVSVCFNENDVEEFCEKVFKKKVFGEKTLVLAEEFLEGKELSVIVAISKYDYFIFPYSQDHKRAYDDNKGPNTGGMGAISSFKLINEKLADEIEDKIIKRTIEGFQKENINYTGFLFFGLMITKNGPFVLEYNVRLGDPETQSILNLMNGDFSNFLYQSINSKMDKSLINFENNYSINIVIASKGYPENYEKGKIIEGLDKDGQNEELIKNGIYIYHAGTIKKEDKFYTNGGRVFSICSNGENINKLREKIYNNIEKVKFDGMFYRRDIGIYAEF